MLVCSEVVLHNLRLNKLDLSIVLLLLLELCLVVHLLLVAKLLVLRMLHGALR